MRKLTTILVFTLACFALAGCGKKWKKPTEVMVLLEPVRFDGNGPHAGDPETLVYKSGFMRITSFQIIGERKQADGIDFERTETLLYNFNSGATFGYDFDIPQGTYTDFDVLLQIGNNNNDPGIKLDMVWVDAFGEEANVDFKLQLQDVFRSMAMENDGSHTIELVEGEGRDMVIYLDFDQWFNHITPSMWDNADQVGGGNSPIKIDDSNNVDLYESIVERLGDGIIVKFE